MTSREFRTWWYILSNYEVIQTTAQMTANTGEWWLVEYGQSAFEGQRLFATRLAALQQADVLLGQELNALSRRLRELREAITYERSRPWHMTRAIESGGLVFVFCRETALQQAWERAVMTHERVTCEACRAHIAATTAKQG